jgi:hypothetical protein
MKFATRVLGIPVLVSTTIVVEQKKVGSDPDTSHDGTIDYNMQITTLRGGNADWLTSKMTADDWNVLEREADDRNN